MVLSKLKFNPKDLLIGLLIISPALYFAVRAYNPPEQAAITRDTQAQETLNIVARGLTPFFQKNSTFPVCPETGWVECLVSAGALDFTPQVDGFIYKTNNDNTEVIIYTRAESLAWRQKCLEGTAHILYSSSLGRTDMVCGTPSPENVKFVN